MSYTKKSKESSWIYEKNPRGGVRGVIPEKQKYKRK